MACQLNCKRINGNFPNIGRTIFGESSPYRGGRNSRTSLVENTDFEIKLG